MKLLLTVGADNCLISTVINMSKQNPKVMVVEDEVLLLQAISKKLKISGMEVVPFPSGQEALDYLNKSEELPDAIWLDYYLKDISGLDFMHKVKESPKWASIPVIVVSNSASAEKVDNMLALGAKKYLLKAQYRLDQIIDIIKEYINEEENI